MNDNFDDEERFDLALNSDFDSALLDCLGDDEGGTRGEMDDNNDGDGDNNSQPLNSNIDDLGGGGGRGASHFSHSTPRPSSPLEEGNAHHHMPRLPSFLFNDNNSGHNMVNAGGSASAVENSERHMMDAAVAAGTAAGQGATTNNGHRTKPNHPTHCGNKNNTATPNQSHQMHPLAISSSASCPSVHNNNINNNTGNISNNNVVQQAQGITGMGNGNDAAALLPTGMADPTVTAALQAAFNTSFMQLAGAQASALNPALVPLAYNALAAGVDLSSFMPQFQAPLYHNNNNNNNMASTTVQEANQLSTHQQQQQQQQQSATQLSSFAQPPPMASVTTRTQNLTSQPHHRGTKKSSKRRRNGQGSSSNKRSKTGGKAQQQQQPPFQIFDAPVELRHNFMQSQRAHGIPVLEDNNSYYFGMTVNGFHPQRSLEQPYMYKSLNVAEPPSSDPVPIVDARHADTGSKRIKNAKEQKRAHRISELIDQLRVKMEKGGWKVGIKSKFHTLSSCSDYVRHLIKENEEKEAAVQRAKKDLDAKKDNMEKEERAKQDPSEPESTTSSLTVSSRSEQPNKKTARSNRYGDRSPQEKKPRHYKSHESALTSGSSDDANKQELPAYALGTAASAVSGITDSNQGTSGNETSNEDKESDETPSSEPAVSSRLETTGFKCQHKDSSVAVSNNKSNSAHSGTEESMESEKTSLDGDFQLDYEEVFLKSNVPQILAATNGRIVSFNDFFLKASGLSKKEAERLTIFSLVESSSLSSLFEIVAGALSSSTDETVKEDEEAAGEGTKEVERKVTPLRDYTTITLPCVDFRTICRNFVTPDRVYSSSSRQLYMTVTLMSDTDISKRCFHCAFTDCKGTKGNIGSVTPELLSALFNSCQTRDTSCVNEQTAATPSIASRMASQEEDGDEEDETAEDEDYYNEEEGTDDDDNY